MTDWKIVAGAVLLTVSITGATLAQVPAAPPKPAVAPSLPADPAQTTASYGDWVLRCVRTGDGGTGPRTCEIVQTIVPQGQQQPVAQVAIGSLDRPDKLHLTILVPTAISLTKAPQVVAAGGLPSVLDLTWRRCLSSGCFADIPLSADAIKMMRTRTEPLNLVFKDAAERDVTLPFSLRGFPQSFDALSKETAVR